jgi:hypothetical protein
VSLSIQKSTPKNYATDSEIDNWIVLLPVQKLVTKNYVAAVSKIDSDGGVILNFN